MNGIQAASSVQMNRGGIAIDVIPKKAPEKENVEKPSVERVLVEKPSVIRDSVEKPSEVRGTPTMEFQRIAKENLRANGIEQNNVVNSNFTNTVSDASGLEKATLDEKELKRRVEKDIETANAVMDVLDKKLRFVQDERLENSLVVQLIDEDSGKIIKQFPPEEVISLMEKIEETVVGLMVDDKV